MEKKELIQKLLQDLSEGNQEPKNSDYSVDEDEFGDVVEMIQNDGLITGASVVRGGQNNKVQVVFLNTAKVTMSGLEYMEQNESPYDDSAVCLSDTELEDALLRILYEERGSRKSLTNRRIRKLLPQRLNLNKIDWLLNNLNEVALVRRRRLDSYKGYDGKMQKGDLVYEITQKGIARKESKSETESMNKPLVIGDETALNVNNKVFIIHGHDNEMKKEVQLFLTRARLDDVVLHECPDKGRTIIDKLINESKDAVYVIALLSPDDELADGGYRARQNVVLEMGYFLGLLGKEKVRMLKKGNVEIPSDLQGILYDNFDEHGSWKMKLIKEMQAVGIVIDIEQAISKL